MKFSKIKNKKLISEGKVKQKPNVNYHGRENRNILTTEWEDEHGSLVYYKRVYTSVLEKKFEEEYSYNHIARKVSYRNSDGVRWEKQYTKDGFEIIYKDKSNHRFDYYNALFKDRSVHHVNKKKEESDLVFGDDIVIDGIDFEDRFIFGNYSLIDFLIMNVSVEVLPLIKNLFGFQFMYDKIVEEEDYND